MTTGPGDRLAIALELSRATAADDPFAFHFEPEDYTVHTPGGGAGRARLAWSPDLLNDLAALRAASPDPELIQRVGELLRAFFSQSAEWALHEAAISQAVALQKPVSLTLRFAAAELFSLPWELCTLGATGRRLGELPGVLLRYEWPKTSTTAEQPARRPEGGRVLMAWSAAGGSVPAAEHIRAISAAASEGFRSFDPERDVLPHASYSRLRDALNAAAAPGSEPIAVVHLLCHGGAAGKTFGLALDGEEGRPVVVDAGRLRALFAEHAGRVRLVVLAACDGSNAGDPGNALGSVAQAIHRGGVAAVVAARYPLSVEGSTRLSAALYRGLFAELSSVEQAFLTARGELDRDAARLDWAALTLHARAADGDDSRPVVVRPFRGLFAFQAKDRRLFFGRDEEVAELVSDLEALIKAGKPRFLVVAGASGTGKSSMVLAGAIPRLLERERPGARWQDIYLRPGSSPLAALDEALERRTDPARPLLLVVDQLEELFTQTTDAATRERFLRRLWALAGEAGSGVHVVLTLRVDFLGRCGEIALDDGDLRLDQVAYDEAHRVLVAQMKRSQLRAAISGPAASVGIELEPGLLERLLDDASGEPGALPLLEYTLDLLWERREGRRLTQAAYDALGGVAGALHGRADALIDELDEADQRIARGLLVRLVDLRGDAELATRRRAPLEELRPGRGAEEEGKAEAERFDRVLDKLVDKRLLVRSYEGGEGAVEVAHEALIRRWARLGAWVEEDRDKLLQLDKIAGWVAEWRARGTLLAAGQLAFAEEAEKRWTKDLAPEAKKLLALSRADAARQRRARRLAVAAIAAAAAGFAVLGWWGLRKAAEADAQARVADERATVAERQAQAAREAVRIGAVRQVADNPTTASLLLREVEARDPGEVLGWMGLVPQLSARISLTQSVVQDHDETVRPLAWSPDGARIVAASKENAAWVCKADGTRVAKLGGHTELVSFAAWSADGSRVVTASLDATARVWKADGSLIATLEGHKDRILFAAWSADGARIVTTSKDTTARVWKADRSLPGVALEGHTDAVSSAAWSADGSRIVTTSEDGDGSARVWKPDGALVGALDLPKVAIKSAAWSADGSRIVTTSLDYKPRIWDADGRLLTTFERHEGDAGFAAWSLDGSRIITASSDGTARIWKADGALAATLAGHKSGVVSAAWSADGSRVVTASDDATARVWKADGALAATLAGHKSGVVSAAWSADGSRIVTISLDKTARVWRVDSPLLLTLEGHKGSVTSAGWSADGARIITASGDGTARVWSADGSLVTTLDGHEGRVVSAALTSNGARIVSASKDGTARIWGDGPSAVATLEGHKGVVVTAAWSSDGARIVTASEDGTARIWKADGALGPTLAGHKNKLSSAAWSADGARIVTASMDTTASVWSAEGALGATLTGHDGSVYCAAWSPDGEHIVTASIDRKAWVWTPDGKQVVQLAGHDDAVHSAAWSPDGQHIVTTSSDKTARVWKADGTLVTTLAGHEGAVMSAAWSPDGSRIVTVSKDKTARVWTVAPRLIQRELWLATPVCLDPAERGRLLGEAPADAELGSIECQTMSRCVRNESGDAVPESYDRCLAQFHTARGARYSTSRRGGAR